MKSTIKIFHRDDHEYLIIVCPDGKIFATSSLDNEKLERSPCYGIKFLMQGDGINFYSQYPTERAAIRAMRAYGKHVVLVGEI